MFENMCLVSKTALFISDSKVSPTGKVKKNVFLVGTKQMLCEQNTKLGIYYSK
jgi:hypothetical protein